jgi:hypothetical protein
VPAMQQCSTGHYRDVVLYVAAGRLRKGCGTFAGLSCARSCIALRSGATGALGQLKKYSYLALH